MQSKKSEKMRESFELFCEKIGHPYTRDGDDYLGSYTKTMWMTWQASRADLVVELPSRRFSKVDDEDVMSATDVIDHLVDVGVSYK